MVRHCFIKRMANTCFVLGRYKSYILISNKKLSETDIINLFVKIFRCWGNNSYQKPLIGMFMYNNKYSWIANQRPTYTFYKYFDWFMFPLLILSGMLCCLSHCSFDILVFVFRGRVIWLNIIHHNQLG